LAELQRELVSYPGPSDQPAPRSDEITVVLRLRGEDGELSFFSTVTTFGTAVDITLVELSIEAFFRADASTAQALRRRAA
jgi:hypothetical protein